MEADNFTTGRFFLAWRLLLATAVIALIGCSGARAATEAGNATVARPCHGGECLIAYRQPEVELMAVLDPEHALGSILAADPTLDLSKVTGDGNNPARCGRLPPGRYTRCTPPPGNPTRYSPYNRNGS